MPLPVIESARGGGAAHSGTTIRRAPQLENRPVDLQAETLHGHLPLCLKNNRAMHINALPANAIARGRYIFEQSFSTMKRLGDKNVNWKMTNDGRTL